MPLNDINTFADCPYRREYIREIREGQYVYRGYCPLGARNLDYSLCNHESAFGNTMDEEGFLLYFCEVATHAKKCPVGFVR